MGTAAVATIVVLVAALSADAQRRSRRQRRRQPPPVQQVEPPADAGTQQLDGGAEPSGASHADEQPPAHEAAAPDAGQTREEARPRAEARTLTLDEAVRQAMSHHETPRMAMARIERARALQREAELRLLPVLSASAGYIRRSRETVVDFEGQRVPLQAMDALSADVTASVRVLDPSRDASLDETERALAAERLDSREVRRVLAFVVADAYLAVLEAEQVRDVAESRVEVAQHAVGVARERFEANLARRSDVRREELELSTARIAITHARGAIRTARLALGILIGRAPQGPLAEPPTFEVAAADRTGSIQRALRSRPEPRVLELRADAARARAEEASATLLPTIDLTAGALATNEATLAGNNSQLRAGVTLGWTLFDATAIARADAEDARARELELEARSIRRQIRTEVRIAMIELETAETALRQAEERVELAAATAEEVRALFREGLATALEHTDAAAVEFDARTDLVRARYAVRRAQLAILRAVGAWPTGRRLD